MAETSRTLTHARVLRIALPIVISNATVPILGAVDTGVVGQMGQAAPIGAVGVGAIILISVYWIFGFLRMGTAGLTSQAVGAGDTPEVVALMVRALLIGGLAGLALIMVQGPLIAGALWVSPNSPEVESLARDYVRIRIWSAPAAIAGFGITGWLIAQERTRGVLLIQLWMNGLNIGLDLWFVLGLGWGVEGVAIATFLAEWSGFALGLWLCRDAFRGGFWRDRTTIFQRVALLRMARVNGDIMVRSVVLQAVFTSFLLLGGRFGDVALAANQILLQFLEITAFALDGFAFAAEALVGKAMGARNRTALRQAAMMTSQWGLGCVVVLALAFALAGGMIIDVMTTAEDVRTGARTYLIYMVFAPLLGLAAWMFDGIFIGATRTGDMRNMMLVSGGIYVVALLALLPMFGNHGLWLALLISLVVRGISLGVRYPALERAAG